MDQITPPAATEARRVDFQTDPSRYRHWKLRFEGSVAHLIMDIDPAGGLFDGYELKLNSYDLGVDIELSDAVQRLRFEHPEIRAVVIRSGKENVFCAGANIRMLGKSAHGHKVNFCKFTNETRLSIEDATENSKQIYLCAVSGTAAGGGYELAATADHIMLIDDRRSTVSLPETPLLAVLPGTGGLTRLTDKRKVRRDRADVFCTTEEGVRGKRAVEWRLVDEVVSPSSWEKVISERATQLATRSDRPANATGIALTSLVRAFDDNAVVYETLRVDIDRPLRRATITIHGPKSLPVDLAGIHAAADKFWPLAMARQLDDAILNLRLNEPELGVIVFRTQGNPATVLGADALLETHAGDWLVREIRHYLKRVLKRVDLTSRSLIALIEPGSCFAGTLAELVFAADRSIMFSGTRSGDNKPPATITLSPLNFGAYPMSNGLTRLETRFYGETESVGVAKAAIGDALDSARADELGLVTSVFDDIDWDDEVRMMLEERASFSPDALTAMEANLRFAGPETMETRIFGRLTAWQNWVFQRGNAVGEHGALKRYGSGVKPTYDFARV
jgi:benzoyl-CoA-dihydrodiol lyase